MYKAYNRKNYLKRFKRTARLILPAGRSLIVIPFNVFNAVLTLLLLMLVVYLLFRSDFFFVETIEVSYQPGLVDHEEIGNGILSRDRIKELVLSNVGSQSIWRLPIDDIVSTVQAESTAIASVSIQKKLPDTLEVVVREKVPMAQLILKRSSTNLEGEVIGKNEYYLVDESGQVYYKSARDMGIVAVSFPAQDLLAIDELVGYTIPVIEIASVRELFSVLDSVAISFQTVTVFDETLVELTGKDTTIFTISLVKDLKLQLENVYIVYTDALKNGKVLESIDARFDRIIVRYQ